MDLVTIEEVRAHCRADEGDDPMLTVYAGAAERAAQNFLNRRVYVDAPALETAQAEVTEMLEAADAAYEAAIEAASGLSGSARDEARRRADTTRAEARAKAREINDGLLVDEDIRAAVLLITGHLYRNREEVVTGQAPAQIPMGAHALLWPYRVGLGI